MEPAANIADGAFPQATPSGIDAVITLLDDLYRRRGEPAEPEPFLDQIAEVDTASASYEAQWRLARLMFLRGETSPGFFRLGIKCGLRAAGLDPERVEGHFWLGVNQALYAEQSQGVRAALLVLEARRSLKRAARISEGYHGAGPLRVLGRLEHKSPWLLGGSARRSLSRYERALELAPDNSVTLLYAAQLAIDTGDLKQAVGLLERVLDAAVDPEWKRENLRDKDLAAALLAEVKARSR
jgi:hypothetical protein